MNSYFNMFSRFPNPPHLLRGQAPIPRRLDPLTLSGATMVSNTRPSLMTTNDTFMGAGPGYYGQSIPNSGRPIIPYTPSPDASIDYTNEPKISWWDDFRSGLDRDFLAAAAQSLGGGGSDYSGRGGGGGVGRAGGRYGANIRPAEFYPAGMPVPGTAPNPSFAQGLVLPRRKQEQYSGGY